jgi:hypothetical protein
MSRRQLVWTADLKGLVIRYNAHGHDGHYDRWADGCPQGWRRKAAELMPIPRLCLKEWLLSRRLIVITAAACNAWNRLAAEPGQITSLCSSPWIPTVNA